LWAAVILESGASSTPLELILFPGEHPDAHPFGITRDASGAACAPLALDRRKECLRASVENCADECQLFGVDVSGFSFCIEPRLRGIYKCLETACRPII
jgi:hypothetical protein